MAGTISSSGMSDEAQGQIAASREAYEREQKTKERVAREELSREAEERRTTREEKERQLKQEEDRARKDREERESRERQQREQMERVERQAKELEERLARLVTSIPPPQVNVIDPEATQVHQGVRSAIAGNNSFPGVTPGLPSSPRLEVAIPAKPKSKSFLMIGAGALVLLLVTGIAGYFLLKSKTTTTVGGTGTDLTNQGKGGGNQTVKADMVAIPGGTFQMGRNDGPPQERPAHTVTVQNFYMDRTEVTNGEYAEFVAAMNYEAPKDWVKGKPLPGQERWPVVNVSSQDAQAFAAWRSSRDGVTYRLPTEEEWEFAARSGDQQAFPWGNTWQDNRAVVKEAAPRPVGSLPDGKNRWGVVDLIGNVWEWTSSQASIYGGVAEIPANTKNWVVARGGSYASDPADRQIPISASYRDWYDPTLRHANFGFRLVRSGR
jgi:formylglycine-generating enzyme required for sulfatase activity